MGLAKDDCGELMDRAVASFDRLYRGQGAGVNGAAGREAEHRLGEDIGARRPVETRLVISDPQEQPAAIHPEEDKPEHQENGHSLEKGRVGSTQ